LHQPDMSGTPSHSRRFCCHAEIGRLALKRALASLSDTQEPAS
jgi:hypothetical protein